MQEYDAAQKADAIILAMLQNQEKQTYAYALSDVPDAKKTALAIATFRRDLIAELMQQAQ